jgi:hypothetical protein
VSRNVPNKTRIKHKNVLKEPNIYSSDGRIGGCREKMRCNSFNQTDFKHNCEFGSGRVELKLIYKWMKKKKLENMWNEAVMAYFKVLSLN